MTRPYTRSLVWMPWNLSIDKLVRFLQKVSGVIFAAYVRITFMISYVDFVLNIFIATHWVREPQRWTLINMSRMP